MKFTKPFLLCAFSSRSDRLSNYRPLSLSLSQKKKLESWTWNIQKQIKTNQSDFQQQNGQKKLWKGEFHSFMQELIFVAQSDKGYFNSLIMTTVSTRLGLLFINFPTRDRSMSSDSTFFSLIIISLSPFTKKTIK